MTYAEVISEIRTIQAQLAQLGLLAPARTGSATSAASFAAALDGASAAPSAVSSTAPADGALVAAGGATGADVAKAALKYEGVPYVFGGESKRGMDCSGLVQASFRDVGVSVPRTVSEQQVLGQKVGSLKDAKPGDLIVTDGGNHISIYLGNNTVIHAPYPGRTVSVQKVWFKDSDILTIRRIVPDAATAPGNAPAPSAAAPVAPAARTAGSTSGGLSPAAALQAATLLSTYGAATGPSASGTSGGPSLGSMLASFGLSGVPGGTGSSSAQQIIAARAALLGASA